MSEEKTPKKVRVVVWGELTQRGEEVKPGSKIEVTEAQAARLEKAGLLDKPLRKKGEG